MPHRPFALFVAAALVGYAGLASAPAEARSGLVQRIVQGSVKIAGKGQRWPQKSTTVSGKVVDFAHPQQKGRLGDRLTTLRLTGQGYQKLKSKYNDLHGIDGVFVKRDWRGRVQEIRLVENKVDSAKLNPTPPAQMSDEWIRRACDRMLKSGDPETARTGRLILDNLESSKLRREVWHHDLRTGTTTVYPVDRRGRMQSPTQQWEDRLIGNEIDRQCLSGLLACG